MQMETTLDTGPVFHRLTTDISTQETGGSLHDRLAAMGAKALSDCLQAVANGQLAEPEPQDHEQAVYAHKLSKAEAELDWQQPARQLERQIRAFNPWPVSWCEIEGQRLRIWLAEATDIEKSLLPGETHSTHDALYIGTSEQALKVLQIQRAGGQKMPVSEFMKAHPTGVQT
jgi:methionyl-tRNA formyltransferase